jgi:polysaccharide export outer membrane protein
MFAKPESGHFTKSEMARAANFVIAVAVLSASCWAQGTDGQQVVRADNVDRSSAVTKLSVPAPFAPNPGPAAVRLGPDDVIQIQAVDVEAISDKPIHIAADGYINLPVVGRVKAAGLTTTELQGVLVDGLKTMVIEPDVSVSLVETHSRPFSVLGAVKNPGVFQLAGRKTILDALQQSGGPRDDAAYTLRITRRKEEGPLPLAGAKADATAEFTTAEISLSDVLDLRDPAKNIYLMPDDVITLPKGEVVYVIGEVTRPGSIIVGGPKSVTALQAIGIVSGFTKIAKSQNARILRLTPGSDKRTVVRVNLKDMLLGKIGDVPLIPDDILFVPNSLAKEISTSTLQNVTGIGLSSIIYRVP